MEIRRSNFPIIPTFNPTRQKQQVMQQQQQQNVSRHPRWMTQPPSSGSAESQIATLQQCISVYLDSIQKVCRAGSWLAETLAFLLHESTSSCFAEEMKSQFSGMLQLSLETTVQAKNELARILMELSLPNLNNNNQVQAIKDCRSHNAKLDYVTRPCCLLVIRYTQRLLIVYDYSPTLLYLYGGVFFERIGLFLKRFFICQMVSQVLEKCIHCLSTVHNTFFKTQINIKTPKTESSDVSVMPGNGEDTNNNAGNLPVTTNNTIDFFSEWESLNNTTANAKSWFASKDKTSSLRKYNGLTDTEIQNLLISESVSDLYMKKLNQKIDTALRNYEVGLRSLPSETTVVFGGFHSSPERARLALRICCSQMEMEQGIQRLPVGQFLLYELPLMSVTVNKKDLPAANSNNSAVNISLKRNAVSHLIQSTNQKLSISETDELSNEILGDICPARWRTHVKASLQLLYGNSGLVIVDTVSRETRNKQTAYVCQKESFIVVAISSTWCIKEDPGTMSLLQRNLDPEKTLATINVKYVSIYNTKPNPEKRFEPGIYVEAFLQTGSLNRRRATQTLRASSSNSAMPVSPMSACWLSLMPQPQGSPVLMTRAGSSPDPKRKNESGGQAVNLVRKSSSVKSEGTDSGSERKRKKKIVVEIKSDTGSDEEKSSDGEDSVRDVIKLLSGSSRRLTRKRFEIEKEAETDEMSEVIEQILDSTGSDQNETERSTTDGDANFSSTDKHSSLNSEQPNKDFKQQHHRSHSDQSQINYARSNQSIVENLSVSSDVSNQSPSMTSLTPTNPSLTPPNLAPPSVFHQKSKSQTLPLPYTPTQNVTVHQYPKSMSNTLPQMRGRNHLHQPLMNHGFPALPSKQTIDMPNNIQQQLQQRSGMSQSQHPRSFQTQDPCHFLQQQFNAQMQQANAPTSSVHAPASPSISAARSPALPTHRGFPPTQNQLIQNQQQQNQYLMSSGNVDSQMNQSPNINNVPHFPHPSQEDNMHIAFPTGNVQALLQHFNKLAMDTKHQDIANENQSYNDSVSLQQLLMLSQNQQENEKLHCQMHHQNSNNNNVPMSQNSAVQDPQRMDNTATVSSTPRWDLGSQQRMNGNANQGLMSQPPAQLMENSSHGFTAGLMHRNFQQQIRLGGQDLHPKEDLDSKNPNDMDQFINTTQHGSLGPIGSPVIVRRRTNEMSPPMHLTSLQANQGSNTWPCSFQNPRGNAEGDSEYEQYIAGITKNAVQRKLQSQCSVEELDINRKAWNSQVSDSWQSQTNSLPSTGNSFAIFATPDLAQHFRGRDTNFSEDDKIRTAVSEENSESGRSASWAAWQLWPTGSLWNWGNGLLNTASGNTDNQDMTSGQPN